MSTNTPTRFILDQSGVSPGNLVTEELHTVASSQYNDHHFIVPNFAPFYVDNFRLVLRINNTTRVLDEDVDFSFSLPYVTGTRITGKQMYGAFSIHNLEMNGILELQYQTVGGDQVCDRLHVLTYLADKAYNPRTTIWDIITNVPNAFPPTPHYQDYDTFFGQEEVVNKLGEIRDAIIQNSSLTQEQIQMFLENLNSVSFSNFILKSGGTMTGPLILRGDPVDRKEAVTREYVDNNTITANRFSTILSNYPTTEQMTTGLGNKVSKSGDTMTGPLILGSPPTQDMQAANKSYVDSRITQLEEELAGLRDTIGNINSNYISKQEVERLLGEVLLRVTYVS